MLDPKSTLTIQGLKTIDAKPMLTISNELMKRNGHETESVINTIIGARPEKIPTMKRKVDPKMSAIASKKESKRSLKYSR